MNYAHLDKALRKANLALRNSPTKGVIFWYNILLSDSEANTKINEEAWGELRKTFAREKPEQSPLVEQVINNLKFIRKQVLADGEARRRVKLLKNFLMQNMVAEDVIDTLKEYVFNNYDRIQAELDSGKKEANS